MFLSVSDQLGHLHAKKFTLAIADSLCENWDKGKLMVCFYSLRHNGWRGGVLGATLHSRQLFFKNVQKISFLNTGSRCFSMAFPRNAPAVLLMKKPSKRFTHNSSHREVSETVGLSLCSLSPPRGAALAGGGAVWQTHASPTLQMHALLFSVRWGWGASASSSVLEFSSAFCS